MQQLLLRDQVPSGVIGDSESADEFADGRGIVEEVARTATQVGNGAAGRIDAQIVVKCGEDVAIVDGTGGNRRGGLVGGHRTCQFQTATDCAGPSTSHLTCVQD